MEKGVTWWVRSTMRRFGVMPYMTPLQRATESSTVPKSVMKTTVGGYLDAGCAAARKPPSTSASSKRQVVGEDRRGRSSSQCIYRSTPEKDCALLEIL